MLMRGLCSSICSLLQDVVEKNGHDEIAPPILHLSAEKLNRYGVYLMDYGMVKNAQYT